MRAAPALVAVLAVSCGGAAERRVERVPVTPSPSARVLADAIPPEAGLVLTLAPNLPGVDGEDTPDLARRAVEVLEAGQGRLRLKWTGQVRVEKPDSSRRREDWVRARANAPRGATPAPTIAAVYETHEVGGTLSFPDFGTASEFLLPGLFPEGDVTVPGSTTLWISPNAFAELRAGGRASVPLATLAPTLREPGATFFRRASELASRAPTGRPGLWTAGPLGAFALRVDGEDVTAPALAASDWFGAYTVLDSGAAPLVLAALPQAPASPPADPYGRANTLRSLLGYRVTEVAHPKRRR